MHSKIEIMYRWNLVFRLCHLYAVCCGCCCCFLISVNINFLKPIKTTTNDKTYFKTSVLHLHIHTQNSKPTKMKRANLHKKDKKKQQQ